MVVLGNPVASFGDLFAVAREGTHIDICSTRL